MSRQSGIDMLFQRPDPANSGQFLNACGVNSKNLQINNNLVTEEVLVNCQDTSLGSAQISTTGAQSVTGSLSGIFEDDASGSAMADAAVSQTVLQGWKLVVPGWGDLTGDWNIGDFSFEGGITGSLNFSASIAQAAPLTFTANA
ncbi:MAG: phage tail tube protein [Pseudomonadota bacterium]